MHPRTAAQLSDAQARRKHPRIDFRTEEGRRHAMQSAPYLAPLVRPGIRALDLGCSFGKSALVMCELGAQVTGLDVSLGALGFARSVARSLDAALEVVAGDYTHLPFADRSFELAVFPHNVVECSPEEFPQVVSETRRVLVAGGVFALSMNTTWAGKRESAERGTVTVPGEGEFAYPTYAWSVDAVREAVSARFTLRHSVPMTTRRDSVWMVFDKGQRPHQ